MTDLSALLKKNCNDWFTVLQDEIEKPYFKSIGDFLEREIGEGKNIYPPLEDIFSTLKFTPFEQVKVVLLGQDPYHGPGQAHGLCFSVKPGIKFPPSLNNIFKELKADLGIEKPESGCLTPWAKQGVLLLNVVLSVAQGKPQSHAKIGWQNFTDRIIIELSSRRKGLLFLLWGTQAQKKKQLIDSSKHFILETTHPSPLSAHRGFLGCRHFSMTNSILRQEGQKEINWRL